MFISLSNILSKSAYSLVDSNEMKLRDIDKAIMAISCPGLQQQMFALLVYLSSVQPAVNFAARVQEIRTLMSYTSVRLLFIDIRQCLYNSAASPMLYMEIVRI